jgi:hypothetical protein
MADPELLIGISATLHGLFTLEDRVSEQEFLSASEAFFGHLEERGFVRGHRVMRRQRLDGFGAALPDFEYHVEIGFPNLEQELACYNYVKRNEEPVRSLHRAMNSKVKRGSEYFFLDVCI